MLRGGDDDFSGVSSGTSEQFSVKLLYSDGKFRNLGKRTTTFIVVCFWDALDGPHISWVPPHYSPSPVPSSS